MSTQMGNGTYLRANQGTFAVWDNSGAQGPTDPGTTALPNNRLYTVAQLATYTGIASVSGYASNQCVAQGAEVTAPLKAGFFRF